MTGQNKDLKRLLLILVLLISIISCKKETEDKTKVVEVKKPEPVIVEFGFKLNDYDVVRDTIVSGDNFGNILEKQNIGDKKVHEITERIKDSFNLRNIRIGKPYTMLRTKDASKKLQVFIYQADIANFYVVDLRDSVHAYKKQKPITIKRRTIATEISGSLSETLSNAGVNASMAQNLEA